ncbi:MAG TPA: PDZ domain-containing protein [Ktedonobacteraceae bacterium]|nr:PDZ domain-containing protein [Ktedonobacteraceae bacterium]
MPFQGYVRFPTIHQDSIVFVAEDDLWLINSSGGRAERLTAGVAEVKTPWFSPDGKQLAFVGKAEGTEEVYLMPELGDEAQRLTFQASPCHVAGWTPGGENILFASSVEHFDYDGWTLSILSPRGGLPVPQPYGMANAIAFGPQGGVVIGRNIGEPARWKRYRGGRTGRLWCDMNGSGEFRQLVHLEGNLAAPCWIGERIYFISDHEGIGNIYSCTPTGEDVRRHTGHEDFYVRNLNSDGSRIVYHAGGDLYLFDPANDQNRRVEVSLPSTRTQRSRKFTSASRHLDTYAVHPQGYAVAITTRGKAFSMTNWEGPVLQHGEADGVRYRHLTWLNDGKRLLAVHDADGQEGLIVFPGDGSEDPRTYPELDLGLVETLAVSPTEDKIALSNHRHELLVVDLETGSSQTLDRSLYASIRGFSWSPDGKWLAYGFAMGEHRSAIKLCRLESGETFFATEPVLEDEAPAFDPDGKYLYFIGKRLFNPTFDTLQFDLHFSRGEKPYAIMLRRDLRSPFIPEPKTGTEKDETPKKSANENNGAQAASSDENTSEETRQDEGSSDAAKDDELLIDLEGISERVVPFPVPEGIYGRLAGLKGKVLFLSYAPESAQQTPSQPRGKIECYDFDTFKVEWSIEGVSRFSISRDAKTLIYNKSQRLRVLKASEKPKDNSERASRESGWIDLERVKVSVQPAAEWRQMFAEAWRLQREYFWTADMSGVDWPAIYAQYAPLVERVGSRAELSDLFWELQGELGTSHAYEHSGDYRQPPYYTQGTLAVDWQYDRQTSRYRLAHIVKGDVSDPQATSPLRSPGLNVQVGDAVLAINGQRLHEFLPPQALLVNQANQEVQLTIEEAESKDIRTITVKTLWPSQERRARYREWVETNRALVHELSGGRLGYIHIPDMGPHGYAEFHRGYLAEFEAQGLVVDVRWNGGGNISGLLLEKLARHRLAYRFSRWQHPQPYPSESPVGPMVALTNEHAGSDGDKFSHSFKLMGLGPLIGTRTWGGVVGYRHHRHLVDGTSTTQPGSANWFKDVGWKLENYGTDPDIEVEITPQDYVNKRDPQLVRAIEECLKQIETYPVLHPEPGERPRTARNIRSVADDDPSKAGIIAAIEVARRAGLNLE